jgi:hypothetical protein
MSSGISHHSIPVIYWVKTLVFFCGFNGCMHVIAFHLSMIWSLKTCDQLSWSGVLEWHAELLQLQTGYGYDQNNCQKRSSHDLQLMAIQRDNLIYLFRFHLNPSSRLFPTKYCKMHCSSYNLHKSWDYEVWAFAYNTADFHFQIATAGHFAYQV